MVKDDGQDDWDWILLFHMAVPDIKDIPEELPMGKCREKAFVFKEQGKLDWVTRAKASWIFFVPIPIYTGPPALLIQKFKGNE